GADAQLSRGGPENASRQPQPPSGKAAAPPKVTIAGARGSFHDEEVLATQQNIVFSHTERPTQHRGFRRPGPHLVHGTERHLWPAQSDGGRYEGLGRTEGSRTLRDHRHA